MCSSFSVSYLPGFWSKPDKSAFGLASIVLQVPKKKHYCSMIMWGRKKLGFLGMAHSGMLFLGVNFLVDGKKSKEKKNE